MNGQDFLRLVKNAFLPFLNRLGFHEDAPSISGRFYRASFDNGMNVVSISYEPGDNALFVMVFSRENGELSNIDDRFKTPRLTDLNSRYMHMVTNNERIKNDAMFGLINVTDEVEMLLLKCAKELCLVLPKYLDEQA